MPKEGNPNSNKHAADASPPKSQPPNIYQQYLSKEENNDANNQVEEFSKLSLKQLQEGAQPKAKKKVPTIMVKSLDPSVKKG